MHIGYGTDRIRLCSADQSVQMFPSSLFLGSQYQSDESKFINIFTLNRLQQAQRQYRYSFFHTQLRLQLRKVFQIYKKLKVQGFLAFQLQIFMQDFEKLLLKERKLYQINNHQILNRMELIQLITKNFDRLTRLLARLVLHLRMPGMQFLLMSEKFLKYYMQLLNRTMIFSTHGVKEFYVIEFKILKKIMKNRIQFLLAQIFIPQKSSVEKRIDEECNSNLEQIERNLECMNLQQNHMFIHKYSFRLSIYNLLCNCPFFYKIIQLYTIKAYLNNSNQNNKQSQISLTSKLNKRIRQKIVKKMKGNYNPFDKTYQYLCLQQKKAHKRNLAHIKNKSKTLMNQLTNNCSINYSSNLNHLNSLNQSQISHKNNSQIVSNRIKQNERIATKLKTVSCSVITKAKLSQQYKQIEKYRNISSKFKNGQRKNSVTLYANFKNQSYNQSELYSRYTQQKHTQKSICNNDDEQAMKPKYSSKKQSRRLRV